MSTAHSRYAQLAAEREVFLERARDCAKVTIPSLLPPSGHSSSSKLPTPWQGMGARGVNNLSNKLIITMLPPNSPMFRMVMDEAVVEQATGRDDFKAELEAALATYERRVTADLEGRKMRPALVQALKHLIVAGNVLIFATDKGLRFFPLDRYVVKRDPAGNILEIITKEEIAFAALPKETQDALMSDADQNWRHGNTSDWEKQKRKTVTVFTHVWLEDGSWKIRQEVKGKTVEGSEGSYPPDALPWMALRFNHIDGEDYGRGYVEEYLGDLTSLEALSRAIVEGSAAAAKVLFLVNPNGTTDIRVLAESESGDIRSGNAQDVTVLQLQKYADFQVAERTIARLEQRLSYAFLMNSSVQRPGERVTAEEIRYVARELEDALGGVYSILSTDLQLQLVTVISRQMERDGRLPRLPDGLVRPTIITGLDALGRGHDLDRLAVFMDQLAKLGPEVVGKYLIHGDYITRMATAIGVEPKGLVKPEEQVMQEEQQAQMQAMAMQMGQPIVQEAAKNLAPQNVQ